MPEGGSGELYTGVSLALKSANHFYIYSYIRIVRKDIYCIRIENLSVKSRIQRMYLVNVLQRKMYIVYSVGRDEMCSLNY